MEVTTLASGLFFYYSFVAVTTAVAMVVLVAEIVAVNGLLSFSSFAHAVATTAEATTAVVVVAASS